MVRFVLLVLPIVTFAAAPLRAQARGSTPSPQSQPSGPNWPFYPPSPKKSVEIGNFYLRRNAFAGALSRFQEAVHDDPHYAPAYLGLGKVYEKTNHPRKALAAYQRYLSELPSDQDAAKAKDVHRAIARLERALASARASPSKRH